MVLPLQMKALVRSAAAWQPDRPSLALELVERPVPRPGHGEVLIKVEAAGCNPSDLAALAGNYASPRKAGEICGFEGCGQVVASGSGILGAYLNGRRVACATTERDGLWAEYLAVRAQYCLPVAADMPMTTAAAFVVNPMTSWALARMAQKARAPSIILSAGASQASRGILALCAARGIGVIPIVRRGEHIAELKAAGAAEVLDQTATDFDERLRESCGRLRPTLFFDAVGGHLTVEVMDAMPANGEVIVYGGLDDSGGAHASVPALIFRGARVRGFWLPPYLRRLSLPQILRIAGDVRRLFANGTFSTRVAGTYPLEAFPAALDAYVANMSAGKVFAVLPSAS